MRRIARIFNVFKLIFKSLHTGILALKSLIYITCSFFFVKDHFCIIQIFKTILFNSNLFELIHLQKNMKIKEMKDKTCWFLKILFQYTQKNNVSIICLKLVYINLHENCSVQTPLNIIHQYIFVDNQNLGGVESAWLRSEMK